RPHQVLISHPAACGFASPSCKAASGGSASRATAACLSSAAVQEPCWAAGKKKERRGSIERGEGAGWSLAGAGGVGPVADVALAHELLRRQPAILVAPLLDVLEVLFPRQQRAAAETLARRRLLLFLVQAQQQFLHHPRRHLVALA